MLLDLVIIVASIGLGIFIGLLFNWRSTPHYGGKLIVQKTEGGKLFTLELEEDPEDLDPKKSIIFKIVEK